MVTCSMVHMDSKSIIFKFLITHGCYDMGKLVKLGHDTYTSLE